MLYFSQRVTTNSRSPGRRRKCYSSLDSIHSTRVEINTGQSITWLNPTTVGEMHTVTFVFDNNSMTGVLSPMAVPDST